MLDTQGFVAEGSGENVFFVRDKVIYTPPVTSILPGITRATVITLAREMGYEVREQQVTRDELYMADEVFFTGTAAEVTPAREIDDRTIGEGRPGPVTKAIQQAYFDTIRGKNTAHTQWLDYVE